MRFGLRSRSTSSHSEVEAAAVGPPGRDGPTTGAGGPGLVVPGWTLRALALSGVILLTAAVVWLVFWLLFRLPLVTFTVAVALLLTALTAPVAHRLRRAGAPPALSASLTLLLLLAFLAGVLVLLGFRATATLEELARPLAAGIDRIRVWLIEGPLALDPAQVADIRNQVISGLYGLIPDPAAGTRMVLYTLSALILILFLVFFLLKDGDRMWSWLMAWLPERRRDQADGAGRSAWTTLTAYAGGIVVVALVDAVGIGAGLLILGVPLWVSLTLLIFLGSFVPLFGATVTGAIAVLVTLVTNGFTDAVIILVVVLVVQQVEGNVLHPLIMGRAVRLHPVVILVAVTAGTLVAGVAGALLAVPFTAVAYGVAKYLRTHPLPPSPAPEAPPSHTGIAIHGGLDVADGAAPVTGPPSRPQAGETPASQADRA